MQDRSVLLVVLDGWGVNPRNEGNAIAAARVPFYDSLLRDHPHTDLQASGGHVGLPDGQMGNSEVGHLNLGAGRIVYQDITRITRSIRDGEFARNPALNSAIDAVLKNGATLHILGLLSDGGVHSHIDHIIAVLDLARSRGVMQVCVHAFLDGRDTPPSSALGYIRRLEEHLTKTQGGRIATVMGRFYAMDRDKRWERVHKAYEAMVEGEGIRKRTAIEAVEDSYRNGKTDEFMLPAVITGDGSSGSGAMCDGDAVIFCNFRSDRAREITRTLTDPAFDGFERERLPKFAAFICMTTYDETFPLPVAFPPVRLTNILGEVVSRQGMGQFRIAETEKYAHVTFFFNGGEEVPFPGEERVLVPSPRDVATYDLKPEMSAREVTEKLVAAIAERRHRFLLVNYANPDMVGHTGILSAAVQAAEVLDECLGRVVAAAREAGLAVIITADHGNLEVMRDDSTGQPHTAHTTDPVPCILVGADRKLRDGGILADVAPTVLELMGVAQPVEMTGRSLLLPRGA